MDTKLVEKGEIMPDKRKPELIPDRKIPSFGQQFGPLIDEFTGTERIGGGGQQLQQPLPGMSFPFFKKGVDIGDISDIGGPIFNRIGDSLRRFKSHFGKKGDIYESVAENVENDTWEIISPILEPGFGAEKLPDVRGKVRELIDDLEEIRGAPGLRINARDNKEIDLLQQDLFDIEKAFEAEKGVKKLKSSGPADFVRKKRLKDARDKEALEKKLDEEREIPLIDD